VKNVSSFVRLLSIAALVALIPLNLFVANRDGSFTTEVDDFSVGALSEERDFVDHPVQTIFTYISRDATFLNPGKGDVVLPFKDRLEMYFGDSLGDGEIFDVRESFTDEELRGIRRDMETVAFPSKIPCPHDFETQCSFYTDWNKSRAKRAGATMVVLRYGETEYAVVDSEKVGLGN